MALTPQQEAEIRALLAKGDALGQQAAQQTGVAYNPTYTSAPYQTPTGSTYAPSTTYSQPVVNQPQQQTSIQISGSFDPATGYWKTQPVITVNGQQYTFNTPQEYANFLQQYRNVDPGKLDPVIQKFNTWQSQWKPQNVQQQQQQQSQVDQSLQQGTGQVGGNPYAMGDYSLVRFNDTGDPNTVWLIDNNNKTVRPFLNDTAFNNAYGGNAQSARNAITNVSSQAVLGSGYQILDRKYAIQENGQMRQVDASQSELQARYGNMLDPDSELKAYRLLSGAMNVIQSPASGIPADFITGLMNSKEDVAFYISALAYGGYSMEDIYRDMKRKYMISVGDNSYNNIRPISASQNRAQYQTTNEYQNAKGNTQLQIPQGMANMLDPNVLTLPISSIPGEAFTQLTPLMNPESPEFRAEMEKYQSAFYDILVEGLSANTEQERAINAEKWRQFREDTEQNVGIKLSENALDAWAQIEQFYSTFSQQGTYGSGFMNESIDDYLRKVRTIDEQNRTLTAKAGEKEEMQYYVNFASPEEIKKLVETDPDKAKRWGLIPSDDTRAALSLETLRAKYPLDKYPTITDDYLKRYIGTLLDENGNMRSTLYKNYQTDIVTKQEELEKWQSGKVLEKSLQDEEKAYAQYTTSSSPFLRDTSGTSIPNNSLNYTVPEIKYDTITKDSDFLNPTPWSPSGSSGQMNPQEQAKLQQMQQQLMQANQMINNMRSGQTTQPTQTVGAQPTFSSTSTQVAKPAVTPTQVPNLLSSPTAQAPNSNNSYVSKPSTPLVAPTTNFTSTQPSTAMKTTTPSVANTTTGSSSSNILQKGWNYLTSHFL